MFKLMKRTFIVVYCVAMLSLNAILLYPSLKTIITLATSPSGAYLYQQAKNRCGGKAPVIAEPFGWISSANQDEYKIEGDHFYDDFSLKNNHDSSSMTGAPRYFCNEQQAIDAGYKNHDSPVYKKYEKEQIDSRN